MEQQILQITTNNRLIVTTQEQLELTMWDIMKKLGFNPEDVKEREAVVTEMPTKLAKKYLKEKGYRVIDSAAFNALLKQYSVSAVKRGKENWYQVKDLEQIPNRI